MIKKILFVGDFYRGDQKRNVRILYELISPVFNNLNIDVSILPEFAGFASHEKWCASLSGREESILCRYNLENMAIIGFEINPIDIAYLDRNNIPWLNFEVHPIRFLDDLYFSITSSFHFDFTQLSADENSIHFAANTIKLRNLNVDFPIKENSLLIVGQTPYDKSVFFDGEFKSLLNYLKSLEEVILQYDDIYYRPHPNLSCHDVDVQIARRFEVKSLNNLNYYDALSCEKLVAVCGISSSCLYEAPYFNKKITFLEKRKKQFAKPVKLQKVLECSELWFDHFLSAPDLKRTSSVAVPENICRDAYGYWAYETVLSKFSVEVQQAKSKASEVVIELENTAKHTDMQFDKLQEQLGLIEANNTDIRIEVSIIRQQHDETKEQLARIGSENVDASTELQLLSLKYSTIQRQIEETKGQIAELRSQQGLQFNKLLLAYKDTDEIMRSQLHNVCIFLMNFQKSWGWRLTAPFRIIGGLFSKRTFPSLESPPKVTLIMGELGLPDEYSPVKNDTLQNTTKLSINTERKPAVVNSFTRTEHQYQRANTLSELLSFHDERFVIVSYLTLLGRAPDFDGLTYYLERLRSGCSKLQLLKQLRRSDEAQSHDPGIAGLDRRIRQHCHAQLPVIGFFLRWLWQLGRADPTS